MPRYLHNDTNPCNEVSITPPDPVYGLDTDGIMHLWYVQGRLDWSGCGQKNRADFVSFAHTIEGRVTCIGCLATEGGASIGQVEDMFRTFKRALQPKKPGDKP